MKPNLEYSHKDFTGIDLTKVQRIKSAKAAKSGDKELSKKDLKSKVSNDMSNTLIVGSCFYVESNGWTERFPADMTGVTFSRCNLDNCIVPQGNIILDDCCHREIKEPVIWEAE